MLASLRRSVEASPAWHEVLSRSEPWTPDALLTAAWRTAKATAPDYAHLTTWINKSDVIPPAVRALTPARAAQPVLNPWTGQPFGAETIGVAHTGKYQDGRNATLSRGTGSGPVSVEEFLDVFWAVAMPYALLRAELTQLAYDTLKPANLRSGLCRLLRNNAFKGTGDSQIKDWIREQCDEGHTAWDVLVAPAASRPDVTPILKVFAQASDRVVRSTIPGRYPAADIDAVLAAAKLVIGDNSDDPGAVRAALQAEADGRFGSGARSPLIDFADDVRQLAKRYRAQQIRAVLAAPRTRSAEDSDPVRFITDEVWSAVWVRALELYPEAAGNPEGPLMDRASVCVLTEQAASALNKLDEGHTEHERGVDFATTTGDRDPLDVQAQWRHAAPSAEDRVFNDEEGAFYEEMPRPAHPTSATVDLETLADFAPTVLSTTTAPGERVVVEYILAHIEALTTAILRGRAADNARSEYLDSSIQKDLESYIMTVVIDLRERHQIKGRVNVDTIRDLLGRIILAQHAASGGTAR